MKKIKKNKKITIIEHFLSMIYTRKEFEISTKIDVS